MSRRLLLRSIGDTGVELEQVDAESELQLQELLKQNPTLIPLQDLGLAEPALVVGRESCLDSGRVDLVLLTQGGRLAVVEFKTGPQNPDFRACLAQLLDYGSDLWGMTLEEFERRVVRPYLSGPNYVDPTPAPASLEEAAAALWGSEDDALGWQQVLESQLATGSFDFVVVAQRFTPPVLRTLEYLNSTSGRWRFSALELIRFEGAGHEALEARAIAAPTTGRAGRRESKAALAGVDELTSGLDDDYRHSLEDFLQAVSEIDQISIYWGTSGCSIRVTLTERSPLSIGWVFPPNSSTWMGLSDVTLGWFEGPKGLGLSHDGVDALNTYLTDLAALPDAAEPPTTRIHGRTFGPRAVVANVDHLIEAIRSLAARLLDG